MQHKVHLKYFGQIAEATAKTTEHLVVETSSIEQLIDRLIQEYPALASQEYTIAVDHTIVDKKTIISKEIEIALLPPFAGG